MNVTRAVRVLAFWAMVLPWSSAENVFFPQKSTKRSWVEARRHCQVCFQELATVTPEVIQSVAKDLSSEHWIGLRKRPVSASDNSYLFPFDDSTAFWSRWANGDPVSFQNWYPGHPILEPPRPPVQCCSCSCTCPAQPTTGPTTSPSESSKRKYAVGRTSALHPETWSDYAVRSSSGGVVGEFGSECVKKPMLSQDEPDLSENYIEDPCVAMLRFGTWVERECASLLPYICYEERFYGDVSVADIKASSASLSWEKGPGDISHYRIEVNGSVQEENHSGLTYRLDNLTAGTFYPVQVFPVKCGRDLNPENGTFYTVPNKVTDLQVVKKTEDCVSLNWTRPTGNVDLYIVDTEELDEPEETDAAEVTVCGLTPGSRHNFTVFSGVTDHSQRSEGSSIDVLTKPATVSNVKVFNTTDSSLVLSWDKPQGGATGYLVTTSWEGRHSNEYTNETEENGGENKLSLENLPFATNITLSITAVVEEEEGEVLTVVCITDPEDITNLTLTSTYDTITAEWDYARGSPHFDVELVLEDILEDAEADIDGSNVTFSNLKSSANYTVTVYSVSGKAKSSGFSKSIFTSPSPPQNPELVNKSKNHLTFSWKPPANTKTVRYLLSLNSSFWNDERNVTLNNETTHTFDHLKYGTTYTFHVQTMAGEALSEPVALRTATDSEQRELTLSAMCSSHRPLLCDSEETRDSAFQELNSLFRNSLGDQVFWKLQRTDTES